MRKIRLFFESIMVAFQSVIVNRLRTVLSLLGITIGIFAIISVFTMVDSLENNIRNSVASLGENIIYVEKWPWAPEEGTEYAWWEYMKRPLPTFREYEGLRDRLKYAESVAFVSFTDKPVKYRNNSIDNVSIWGASHELDEISNFDLDYGRYFTEFESASGKNITLIGHAIANELFEKTNPLGEYFTIMGRKVRVIGVMTKEGKDPFGGGSMDETVILPVNFSRTLIDVKRESAYPQIWVKALPGVSNQMLIDDIRNNLRSVRRLKPKAKDNFALNQTSIISQGLDQVFGVLNTAGFFIGIFAILVGGFGIANIMFVSVRERTRIIGIQKAIGAKKHSILTQFLAESVLLALTGGIIGLIMVFFGAMVVSRLIDFPVSLTPGNIILGVIISAGIGIISGFAPALSAARMNPVDAINTTF